MERQGENAEKHEFRARFFAVLLSMGIAVDAGAEPVRTPIQPDGSFQLLGYGGDCGERTKEAITSFSPEEIRMINAGGEELAEKIKTAALLEYNKCMTGGNIEEMDTAVKEFDMEVRSIGWRVNKDYRVYDKDGDLMGYLLKRENEWVLNLDEAERRIQEIERQTVEIKERTEDYKRQSEEYRRRSAESVQRAQEIWDNLLEKALRQGS